MRQEKYNKYERLRKVPEGTGRGPERVVSGPPPRGGFFDGISRSLPLSPSGYQLWVTVHSYEPFPSASSSTVYVAASTTVNLARQLLLPVSVMIPPVGWVDSAG